jgi:DNA polymerase III delta prime subunit
MQQLWATKYRPTSFDEMVANNNFSSSREHLLLHSKAAGVGKTTYAHVIANHFGYPLHIFNASSKKTRGIAFVEEELLPLTRSGNYKQYILLDEADQLTHEAQSALKGVIENAQGLFILTCNNIEKVSPYLRSRCRAIEFRPIMVEEMMDRLEYICGQEHVVIHETQLQVICKAHAGDLRNAINALQAFHGLGTHHTSDKANSFILSLTVDGFDTHKFLSLCFQFNEVDEAYKLIKEHDTRKVIRAVFDTALSNAQVSKKIQVVDAAIISERDILNGVDDDIVKYNFVRLLVA